MVARIISNLSLSSSFACLVILLLLSSCLSSQSIEFSYTSRLACLTDLHAWSCSIPSHVASLVA